MDNSEKQGSSEASSSDERSSKRSYECAFCKRGFTNAQALGGHMNIHRKDRAKAKQHVTVPNNSSNKFQQELFSPARPYVPSNISSGPAMFLEAYHACFMAPPVPSPSPRILHPQYGYYGSSTSGAASLGANEELLGANLSLGLGPVAMAMESDSLMNKRFMRKEDNEVDLELRLGRHFP